MHKLFTKPKAYLAATALLCAISMPTQAQELDVLNKIYSEIKGFLDKNLEQKQPYFDQNKTDIRNNLIPQVKDAQDLGTTKSVADLLPFMIGPPLPLPGNMSMAELLSSTMMGIKGGDSFAPTGRPGIFINTSEDSVRERQCGNLNFSLQSLVGPAAYQEKPIEVCGTSNQKESTFAQNFILTAADMGNPINDFTPSSALKDQLLDDENQAAELAKSKPYVKFMMQRRNVVAMRSVGLSNLYYLYNLRLAKFDVDRKPMSQMSIYEQNATSRIGNAQWYSEMMKAYPAQLAREQVFILAEMQQELHQMNTVLQRQLATQSAQVLQGASFGAQLLQINMREIDEEINKIKKKGAAEEAAASSSNKKQ